jgi:diguanylate cyclase (GGDEF)-like protein
MLSPINILLISAMFCIVMLCVLASFVHSEIPGIKEWSAANGLAFIALLLFVMRDAIPDVLSFEAANGLMAASSAATLIGFRRFLGQTLHATALGAGIALMMLGVAVFHYAVDSFALRTATVTIFQGIVCLAIGLSVLRSGKIVRSRYPTFFTGSAALLVALGSAARIIVYATGTDVATSVLEPSPWNLFFLSAGTMVLPVLTLGAVMMVHDAMLAKAEHTANRDFLTGIWSRRAFFELAERELLLTRRTGRPLSLLLFDVDRFKSINDTHGHAAGDRVLVDITLRADAAIRNIDYFARVGGEEFAVLLPETACAAALMVAERLRATLEKPATPDNAKGESGVAAYTVSVGIATLRGAESFHELMRRADAALYQAKASGRNMVVCETDLKEIPAHG